MLFDTFPCPIHIRIVQIFCFPNAVLHKQKRLLSVRYGIVNTINVIYERLMRYK